MATVSRGQIVTQNRVQEAFDFLTKNVSDAVKMVQQRKQLDLMQEQIRNEKWRMMHDALWKAFEADAKTNQWGERGAFENFRGPLTQLYSMAGMKPESIEAMWQGIEQSGLSADILKKAAYSHYLTNEDLSDVEPETILREQQKLVQEQIESGINYPKIEEQRTKEVMVQEPTAGGTRLNQQYYDQLKNLMIVKTHQIMDEKGLMPGQAMTEDVESGGITLFGKRIPFKIERTAKREERREAGKAAAIDEVIRQYTAGTGLSPEHIEQLKAEVQAVVPGFAPGKPPTEMAGAFPTGQPYGPGGAKGVVEIKSWTESREMTPQEKIDYRKTLVKENKLPAPVADALLGNNTAKAAMENFIQNGTVPSPKAQAEMRSTTKRMQIAFKKPSYAQNFRERAEAMLPSVIRQIGRAYGGPDLTDEQATILGQQNLVGIMERDYLVAQTDRLRYLLSKDQWEAGNKKFITVELPAELGGGTRELTFNQFISFWELQNDLLKAQMTLAARQTTGGMDMDFVLGLMKFTDSYMEPIRKQNLTPEQYKIARDRLYQSEDTFATAIDLQFEIFQKIKTQYDAEGNPISIPEIYRTLTVEPSLIERLFGWWKLGRSVWKSTPGGAPTFTPPEGQEPKINEEQNLRDDQAVLEFERKKRGQQ